MKDKWTQIASQWSRFGYATDAKKRWTELTYEELTKTNGDRKALLGLIQERYNISKKEADKQIDIWANKLKV